MSLPVRIASPIGGLIIIGSEVSGRGAAFDALCDRPLVEPVETDSDRLEDWQSWQGEVAAVTRRTSAALRAGNAALLYLATAVDAKGALSADARQTVSRAMGRVLSYVADCPAYLAILGSETAQVMFAGDNAELDTSTTGTIGPNLPLRELGPSTMFPGMPLVICPAAGGITVLAEVVSQLEACRF